jgi:hypothetical protein
VAFAHHNSLEEYTIPYCKVPFIFPLEQNSRLTIYLVHWKPLLIIPVTISAQIEGATFPVSLLIAFSNG